MKRYIACWTDLPDYDEAAVLVEMQSFVDASEAVKQSLFYLEMSPRNGPGYLDALEKLEQVSICDLGSRSALIKLLEIP